MRSAMGVLSLCFPGWKTVGGWAMRSSSVSFFGSLCFFHCLEGRSSGSRQAKAVAGGTLQCLISVKALGIRIHSPTMLPCYSFCISLETQIP